jgi:hypothetical protein
VFVTHGYGGLVVKQAREHSCHAIDALILLARKAIVQAVPRHLDITKSTKAIIFLGCPHFGSEFAKWGVVAAQVLYPLGSNPGMLQGLEKHSRLLHELHRRFVENFSDATVINFFEQRKVRILKLVLFRWEKLVSSYEPCVRLIVLTVPSPVVC